MLGYQHLRLPWELDDGEVGSGGVAPGKQTLTARLPPKLGGPVDPTAAAAPGLGALEGTGAKPAPPSDDAFAVHLEAAKARPTDEEQAPEVAADPAAEAAAQAAAMRQLLRADGRFIARYVDALDLTDGLKLAAPAAELALSRFEVWRELGKVSDLVAEVRKHAVEGVAATLLQTDNAWEYLVAVLDKAARRRLYDCLADGNADARSPRRFSEDIVEFWDVQMRKDGGDVKLAYHQLVTSEDKPGALAMARARIITTLREYRALDQRYGMKGALLDRFLQKVDVDVTLPGGPFGIGEEQTRMLDDIKRRMGPSLGAYMEVLQASNMPLLKGEAPELTTLGGSIAQDVEETVQDLVLELEAVGDVVAFLASASKETAQDCLRWLARTPSKLPLLLDFIAEQFEAEKLPALCAYGLSLLSAETILEILQKLDVERIGQFYLALVTCAAGVMFLPQLFAAYWLLPDKTRDKVFSTLGKTAFEPLIEAAKDYIVPILQDLIDRHLPVGVGVYSERGLSASVAYAVAGGESSFSITRTGPGTLRYDERFLLRGGVELSRGVGKTEGKKDSGETQKFWAHEAAMTMSGQMQLVSQNRYEFPFRDDDAFVGLLAAFVDIEAAVSAGALVFDELDKIDPFPYLVSSKLEPKLTGEGQLVGSSGMREGKGGKDGTHDWEGGQKPSEMGSSVGGPFGAQASARISRLLEAGGALEIERKSKPDADRSVHEVSVQVGAKQAVTASSNVPGLGALLAAIPKTDAGLAVKATFEIEGLSQDAPEQVGEMKLSLVGSTGDMDGPGAASETEVELPDGIDLDSAEAFIAGLGDATFKRKIGIASDLGRKAFAAIDNQKNLTAQLKERYEHVGVKLRGAINLTFELGGAAVREIAGLFLELLRGASSSSLGDLRAAVTTFLTTGDLPDSVEQAGKRVAALLASSEREARYRIDAGVSGAVGDVVGGVGGHGFAGLGLIFEGDVAEALDALGADELLDVIRGKLADLGDMELDWTP